MFCQILQGLRNKKFAFHQRFRPFRCIKHCKSQCFVFILSKPTPQWWPRSQKKTHTFPMLAHPSETASQASRGHSPNSFRHLHKDYDANPTSATSCCVAFVSEDPCNYGIFTCIWLKFVMVKCRYTKYIPIPIIIWILWVFCVTCFFSEGKLEII